ncbi:MAG: hypothetical protein IGS03_11995 [Candidatus Sericytochromatia bacterium]|nr:hypothetical protein [Candidatus Sericytochromatia bacterium]
MSLVLALCFLLVIASLILALNAMTRLETLRQENSRMLSEIQQLRQDYTQLQEQLTPSKTPGSSKDDERPSEVRAAAIAASEPAPSEARQPEQILKQALTQVAHVLNTYQKAHQGLFPAALDSLIHFANRRNLQQDFENPYTGARNPLISEDVLLNITHEPVDEGLSEFAGRLLYQAQLNPAREATGYMLAAFDGQGRLLQQNQQVYTLSEANA